MLSFDMILQALLGILGAILGSWLIAKLAKWVPAAVGAKGQEQLLKEHKVTIRVANLLAIAGMVIGVLCYALGWLSRNDWRGAGLGVGLMSFLPVAYMIIANAPRGTEAIKECMVTFAITQHMPIVLLFPLMTLMIIAGMAAAASLLL